MKVNVLWDSGSTISFITFDYAKRLKLQGNPVRLEIVTIGGTIKKVQSTQYSMYIKDEKGCKVPFEVLGIEVISNARCNVEMQKVKEMFPWIDRSRLKCPTEGSINMLVGFDHAAHHPVCIDRINQLVLLENRFGYIVASSHKAFLKDEAYSNIVKQATVLHNVESLEKFYSIENLGVSCIPSCGACKCGKCHAGGKDMTIKEEEEYLLIKSNIQFQKDKGRYIARYPWIKSPQLLPDNRCQVYAMLASTEKRLLKNSSYAALYSRQIEDMLERKVARKVSQGELARYKGPKFYISHFAVMKPDSRTTPCRIVFNSSKKYNGHALNDYLAKGPCLLKKLLGIFLRFRQGQVGFIGDIAKMFHSIDIPLEDQMLHLFFWRNLEIDRLPDTFAIGVVNFGDRPSSAIAEIALKKAAVKGEKISKKASEVILESSYMDDISGSSDTKEEAETVTRDISKILLAGGFKIKQWFISGANNESMVQEDQKTVQNLLEARNDAHETEKVLGMSWDTRNDTLFFSRKSNIIVKEEKINKRYITGRVNSWFDPIGLLSPVLVKAKILLRKIWGLDPKIDWDDELPREVKEAWCRLFDEMNGIYELSFDRALTPDDTTNKSPVLIIFSDGSREAYGGCCVL